MLPLHGDPFVHTGGFAPRCCPKGGSTLKSLDRADSTLRGTVCLSFPLVSAYVSRTLRPRRGVIEIPRAASPAATPDRRMFWGGIRCARTAPV